MELGLILKVAKDTTLNENYIKPHSNTLFLRVQRHDQRVLYEVQSDGNISHR